MKIYIYYLVSQIDSIPFYVGATKNIQERYTAHKYKHGRKRGAIILKVYKTVKSWEAATKEEGKLLIRFKTKYGKKIINKHKPAPHQSWGRMYKNPPYQPRVDWVYIPKEEKDVFFKKLPQGGASQVAYSCDYSPERVRQIFVAKPDKISRELHTAILEYRCLLSEAC